MSGYCMLEDAIDILVTEQMNCLISSVRDKILRLGNFRDITINELEKKIVTILYKESHKKMYELNGHDFGKDKK